MEISLQLRPTKMENDCNLKKLANVLDFRRDIFQKISRILS